MRVERLLPRVPRACPLSLQVPGDTLALALHTLREAERTEAAPWQIPDLQGVRRLDQLRRRLASSLCLPRREQLLQLLAQRVSTVLDGPGTVLGFVHLVSVTEEPTETLKYLKFGKSSLSVDPWLRGSATRQLFAQYKRCNLLPRCRLQLVQTTVCRVARDAWVLEQLLHGEVHRLHPDLVIRSEEIWLRRRRPPGHVVPRYYECYQPSARAVLLQTLERLIALDPSDQRSLLKQNWSWWCRSHRDALPATAVLPKNAVRRPLQEYAFLTIRNQAEWAQYQHLCFNATKSADFFRYTRGKKFQAYSKNLQRTYEEGNNLAGDRRRLNFVFPIYLIKFQDLPVDLRREILEHLKLYDLIQQDPELQAGEAAAPQNQPSAAPKRKMQRPAAARR